MVEPTAEAHPPLRDAAHELEVLIRSRYGLIVLEPVEASRAGTIVTLLGARLDLPVFRWEDRSGLRRDGVDGSVYDTGTFGGALAHLAAGATGGIYHFHHPPLAPATPVEVLGLLRDAVARFENGPGALILSGPEVPLPDREELLAARVRLPPPDPAEFEGLLERVVRDLTLRRHVEVDLTREERGVLLRALTGLTLAEAEKVLTRAIVEDGRLDLTDVDGLTEAKRTIVERDGLLEYYPLEDVDAELADLSGLRGWLSTREGVVHEPERAAEYGLPFPRGILLLGVPGCGKSLCAKAVAKAWKLPLLKFDPAGLYNRYVGESEKNLKRATEAAEAMAPCVLWIDEIEKALAGSGDADGGVSRRLLGSLLSWMQERKGPVFLVATANDVTQLPPELLRKGRFDEVFFVDLPDAPARSEILEIHLRRRGIGEDEVDRGRVAAGTEGYSGAELEQLVLAASFEAFARRSRVDTGALLEEAARTRPLSTTMAERIDQLRAWAEGRAVRAN